MAAGFRVRYWSMDQSVKGERIVFHLPMRIGRNGLNHVQILQPYVSDFHAVIESVDGQLCVRDLNSKNGLFAPSGSRLEPNLAAPLAPMGNAFVLGGLLQLQLEVFEHDRSLGERVSGMSGTVVGNRAMLEAGRPARQAAPGEPRYGAPAEPPVARGSSPPARPSLPVGPANPPWGDAAHGRAPPNAGPSGQPPWQPRREDGSVPGPPPPAGAGGVSRSTQHFQMGVETMAFMGLRELANSLVPGIPLETTGDVARFLTKLHDSVEVFCRCFVPLREGYAQFVSDMDLRRAASLRSLNHSVSAMAVEIARDPAALALGLLDWRNHDYDAPGVVQGIFADLMIHQLALLESVLRGVKALLDELSPNRIEQIVRAERSVGLGAFLGRYRALWRAFQVHYEELTNETRTFEVVFGPDFAATYREYLSRQQRTGP
ncbi:MAG: FHA domain-containing protein [Myxococcota bacterium]|nr:FHA domain-containing protein [Myxococcota bacterium]